MHSINTIEVLMLLFLLETACENIKPNQLDYLLCAQPLCICMTYMSYEDDNFKWFRTVPKGKKLVEVCYVRNVKLYRGNGLSFLIKVN